MTFDVTKYYKEVQSQASSNPIPWGAEMVGYTYRGFIISRATNEFMLWQITLDDGNKPPVPLRGSFTKKSMAEFTIDDFLEKHKDKVQ